MSSDSSQNGNGDSSSTGSDSDYYNWDWQTIAAAINGGTVVSGPNAGQNDGTSSPQTLYDAGDTFEYVRSVLAMVGQSLQDQANALASGSDAPWQGQAADQFLTTMTSFSQDVTANAQVLAGGPSGTDNVPQQLVNNGNALANAQATVSSIDSWYAHQAALQGITPMSNGDIPVSLDPKIPPMMQHDMLNYALLPLAKNFQVTIDQVVSPTPSTPNLGGDSGGGNNPAYTDQGPNDPAYTDTGDQNLPASSALGALGSTTDPSLTGDNAVTPDLSPYSGSANTPADARLATDAGPAPGALTPYSGLTTPSDEALTSNGPGSLGGDVQPYGGGPGATSGGGLTAAPLAGLSPYSGTGASPADDGLDSATTPLSDLESYPGGAGSADGPGDGDLAGDALPLTAAPLAGLSPYSGTGASPADEGLDSATTPLSDLESYPGGANGLNDALSPYSGGTDGATDEGLPTEAMPFMPGAGNTGAANLPTDATDASGLLGGDAAPWTPTADTTADDAPLAGATPNLASDALSPYSPGTAGAADEGLPAEGMPFMPGAGNTAANLPTDSTDASGLLGGDAQPWTPTDETTADDAPLAGATPVADETVSTYPGDPADLAAPAEAMPYMPGAGNTAAANLPTDATDASGLLGGDAQPWTPTDETTADDTPLTGAAAAAPGATAPVLVDQRSLAPDSSGPAELPGAGDQAESAGEAAGPEETAGIGEGVPLIPGTAAGAGAAEGAVERSDASGLLGDDAGAWVDETVDDEPAPGAVMAVPAAAAGTPPGAAEPADLDAYESGEGAYEPSEGEADEYDHDDAVAEPPPDRVAVLAQPGTPDDVSAWDSSAAAASFLLWSSLTGKRREGAADPTTRYATEESAWRDEDDGAEEVSAEPGLATWRRAGGFAVPASEVSTGGGLRSSAAMPSEEELAAIAPPRHTEQEEPAPAKGVADLLVQDSDLWGSWNSDPGLLP